MGEAVSEVFELKQIDRTKLDQIWPQLEGTLLAYSDTWDGDWTLGSILGTLLSGRLQLWCLIDQERTIKATLLTRITKYPVGDIMEIIWTAGTNYEVGVMSIESLERIALEAGCVELRAVMGRKGFAKLLEPFGYGYRYQVVGKKLTGPGKGN